MKEQDGWDSLIKTEIERFLARYQALEIAVRDQRLCAHVPYMMGSVTWVDQPETLARQRPRHQARLRRVAQARRKAPPALQAFFHRWFSAPDGTEPLVAAGRSGPEEIRQLLQAAVDVELVPTDQGRLTGMALRAWLQRYGIGVDCSGFVQHTLSYLLQAGYAALGKTPGNPQETELGWMRGVSVHRKLVHNDEDRRFDIIATPAEARPADILVSPGHTRLIVDAQRTPDQALLVTLAESTSITDLVAGSHFLPDVGPRLYHVLYTHPDRPIQDQLPLHKRTSEAAYEFEPSEWEQQFLLARNRKLLALQRKHSPPTVQAILHPPAPPKNPVHPANPVYPVKKEPQ